jgi:hypothetical protein
MMEEQKLKVVFAEGCFDNFEGTPEELADLVAEIHRLVESGEFFDKAEELSEEEAELLLGNKRQARQ